MILHNFKGIKDLEINANGESLSIYGDNATGKTTVFDAFTWLLFGKDSLGRSDFGIKTQDEYGNAIHNLEHSVECELAIDNTILTLKKVYAEKWTKKRGSAEAEFTGHETKYFVNEVPVPKKDYEAKITSIVDENLFKIITNPLYFNEHMKWQDRRAILLSLCENITDEDILDKDEQFAPLSAELQGRTVQEFKKIVQSKQSSINDSLKAIPGRIAEANLAIPENVANVDESEKASIEKKIADLNDEITDIKNGSGENKIKAEIQNMKNEIASIKAERCDVAELENELNTKRGELLTINHNKAVLDSKIALAESNIKHCEDMANKFRQMWHEVNSRQYTGDGICPTCGQAFPEEQIESAKAKFNIERAEELEKITTRGKEAKAGAQEEEKSRTAMVTDLEELKTKAETYEADVESLIVKIEKKKAEHRADQEKRIADILIRIAEAENKAENGTEDIQSKIYPIEEQITTEKAKLAEIDKAIAGRDIAERQKQRIAELEADEKRLAGEYAELDKMSFLIDEFIKCKVEMLSEEINSHFRCAKFKLFDVQINGGIAECCETTYRGVEYSDLNNASRINIGLDIINTLCEVNCKTAPIIIDNAESVTQIIPTKSQKICLVVSANDNTLRVEKGV
jgi:DNA repair exonuclease SbcCD ATPase subunit